ncbi:hypothetical protein Pcac1_g2757 [Phytophthora cactorum]|nr:hypothetical protein Pcac1_g2757 [Phytophthora cactorum]
MSKLQQVRQVLVVSAGRAVNIAAGAATGASGGEGGMVDHTSGSSAEQGSSSGLVLLAICVRMAPSGMVTMSSGVSSSGVSGDVTVASGASTGGASGLVTVAGGLVLA